MRPRRNEAVERSANSAVTPGSTRGPASCRSIDGDTPAQGRGDEDGGPIRSCILTRDRAPRDGLIRLALAPDGRVLPDVRAKAAGRGAWIGVARSELETALAKGKLKGALARAFKTADFTLSPELPALIAGALERAALDRLGLEARAGTLVTGSERIADAARAGRVHALYHAADASEDGARRLAQAWRVGSNREGEPLEGLALPVARPILSLALGRENVVHVALTDRAAAARVGALLGRWLHFIGPAPLPPPRDTASRGATVPELPGATTAVN